MINCIIIINTRFYFKPLFPLYLLILFFSNALGIIEIAYLPYNKTRALFLSNALDFIYITYKQPHRNQEFSSRPIHKHTFHRGLNRIILGTHAFSKYQCTHFVRALFLRMHSCIELSYT